ncbi:hypothetical protein B0H15DRAFT_442553 [Mycena belliarum]|uniref:DUF6534 domain-containing protein n=1 Tax=Mycena belliarum TaxID=1033014 RepID=A0AAD6U1Y5_9AGAR|nr:hypothetical protein B0H15DRAFT_442553 [Mycena belliae]
MSSIPAAPNFGRIVSPQLIGSLLNFFFFGTLLVQVYVYRVCFPKDSLAVKLLVYFIFLAMLVCTCLNAADIQYWFGAGFGNILRFADPRNSRFYTPLMGSFIGMLVQLFFSYRIWVLRRAAWPLSVLIALFALMQCAGGMGAGIIAYMSPNRSKLAREHKTCVRLWLAGGVLANVLIATMMSILFFKAKSTPIMRDFVRSIVRMIIETNLFTAIVALIGLALYAGIPNTTYFVCPTMILPGIYANTLLVLLNNRVIAEETSAVNHPVDTQSYTPSAPAGAKYSENGPARVLALPARSFERRTFDSDSDKTTVLPPRSSEERKWGGADENTDEEENDIDNRA